MLNIHQNIVGRGGGQRRVAKTIHAWKIKVSPQIYQNKGEGGGCGKEN